MSDKWWQGLSPHLARRLIAEDFTSRRQLRAYLQEHGENALSKRVVRIGPKKQRAIVAWLATMQDEPLDEVLDEAQQRALKAAKLAAGLLEWQATKRLPVTRAIMLEAAALLRRATHFLENTP